MSRPQSFSRRGIERRQTARERAAARVTRPVEPTSAQRDPLFHGRPTIGGRAGRLAAYLVGALAVHVGGALAFSEIGDRIEVETDRIETERVVVRVVDPRSALELPEPQIEEPVRIPEPEPSQPTIAPAPAEVPPPVRKRPARAPRPRPADPVNRDAQPAPTNEPPRRRVVGLSLESTVSGGTGPKFAVGNTRMGETAARAEDPTSAKPLAPSARGTVAGTGDGGGPNRVATNLPTTEQKLTKPRRLSEPKLKYPGVLKAQGIEGNVAVLIRVSTAGAVSSVKVIKGSGYSEFDRAARKAALKERFSPATRGGKPVEYTLKYTYRFRLNKA